MGARPALALACAVVLLGLCLLPGRVLAAEPVAPVIVISGALAPTRPGRLHEVEARRVRNGWGLDSFAPPDVVLVATESCSLLGLDGMAFVKGQGQRRVRVVDCQQAGHRPRLSELGLAADYDGPEELAHR